ncbi:hypothetical protein PLEOSDRAFT_1108652 [Pleurotus ostreatus PC15]|uniref:F-box domain-containing protein n=1 Tax=Pleurotus ostreatus (strain PC15) TaxID=1137138 RepID=A0A067NFX3_PLEO1|nr:hypothetical protein PLEOSDRAFT_1108652 [Pleurotus ostreatus PC15]
MNASDPESRSITIDTKDASQSVDFAERLPIELIHHIIAHLDDRVEDYYRGNCRPIPSGLAACSLVCRAWSHICRARIFRTVPLKYGEDVSHRRLSFLYSTAPHLCEIIRNLSICLGGGPSTSEDWIPHFTGRFTNLSELRLHAEFITGPILGVLSDFGIMSLLPTLRLKRLALDSWSVDEAVLDLIPILSACSNTLESLSLEIYEVYRQGSDSVLPPSACLNSLRNLNMIPSVCTLPPTNLIRCPHLESLTVGYTYGDSPWDIPSWIPASLSELILHCDPTLDFPDFVTAIRPSILRITISGYNHPLFDIMTWIGGCIGHLPDETTLRQLAIVINGRYPSHRSLYPEVADYAPLCSAILPLFSRGALEKISLNIDVYQKGTAGTIAASRAVGAVEEAFAPILEEVSVNGFQRITCDHGKIDALLVKNMVETFRDGHFV